MNAPYGIHQHIFSMQIPDEHILRQSANYFGQLSQDIQLPGSPETRVRQIVGEGAPRDIGHGIADGAALQAEEGEGHDQSGNGLQGGVVL